MHQHEKSVYKKNCLVQFISKADICAKQLKMINIAQIKWYFSKLPIEKIGFESGFIQVQNKLTALSFVLGFFESFSSNGEVKTSLWVQRIIGEEREWRVRDMRMHQRVEQRGADWNSSFQ